MSGRVLPPTKTQAAVPDERSLMHVTGPWFSTILFASENQFHPGSGRPNEPFLLVDALPTGVALRSTRSASMDRAHSTTSRTSRVPYPLPRCSGRVMTLASRTVRPQALGQARLYLSV
jgi:hypothetical protein